MPATSCDPSGVNNGAHRWLAAAVLLQFTLGVLTVLSQVNITLGVLYQFGALLLLSALLNVVQRTGREVGSAGYGSGDFAGGINVVEDGERGRIVGRHLPRRTTIFDVLRPISMRARVLLSGTLLISCVFVQGQSFQKFFAGNVGWQGYRDLPIVRTTDGGTVIRVAEMNDSVLWKMDANGDPLWQKHFNMSILHYDRMPDGGIVMMGSDGEQIGNCMCTSDTAFYFIRLTRITANGDMIWSKELTFRIIAPYSMLGETVFSALHLATDTAGRIFVEGDIEGSNPTRMAFASLDASGQLLWSTMFHDDIFYQETPSYRQQICGDGAGGCFFYYYSQGSGLLPSPIVNVGHINQLGEPDWAKGFQLGSLGVTYALPTGCALSNGHFIAGGGYGSSFFPGNCFFISVTIDGTLDWAKEYQYQYLEEIWLVRTVSNGDIFSALVPNGTDDYKVLHLAPDGTLLHAAAFVPVQSGSQTCRAYPMSWDALDTTVSIAAGLISNSSVLNNNTTLWALGPQLDACLLTPASISDYNIPESDSANVFYAPSGLICFTIDTTFADSSMTPPTTWDLCDLLNSVPTLDPGTDRFHVLNTNAASGEPIIVEASGEVRVTIFDAAGRRTVNDATMSGGRCAIPTSGWPTGLYLLRAKDAHSEAVRTVRVVIE